MIRVIALITAFFLFFASLESFAGFWLAGRWFISSRYASLTLGVVKGWLDRGIINSATQTAKVFIQRNGKWILLTLGLSQVISEVQQRMQAFRYCYMLASDTGSMAYISFSGSVRVSYFNESHTSQLATYTYSCSGSSTSASDPYFFPLYYVYELPPPGYSGMLFYANLPAETSFVLRTRDGAMTCNVQIIWRLPIPPCSQVSQDRSQADDWQNERRQVPVRVYPNPADFVRSDVIAQDPALSYLRDEYQRIASDSSIPTIPSDALSGVELPSVDWSIPPEEALDHSSESSRPGQAVDYSSVGSLPGEGEGQEEGEEEGNISVPGLNTDLNIPAKRSFPVELVNSLVQSHPLLRVLQGVSLDVGGGGSCVIGSRPFEFDFCPFQWVLNLMGSVVVFISFLTGLFWAGRSD